MREHEALARTDLSSVEVCCARARADHPIAVDEVRARISERGTDLGYGTTESGPIAFGATAGLAKPDLALGWPLPGVEVRLIATRMAKRQTEGELWIRTPANMTGYLNLPAKTQEVLTADGWYKSADVFRRDAAGAYTFVGRTDDMFVCGGENIYPGEVESHARSATTTSCRPALCRCPTRSRVDKPFAFVVLRSGACLTEDEVKRYALDNAPAYQHPRGVVFMTELPLATTNKVDRKALGRLPASAGRHPSGRTVKHRSGTAP